MTGYFTCVACNAQGQFEVDGHELTAAAARTGGWFVQQGIVYCPNCKEKYISVIAQPISPGGGAVSS